MRILIMIFCKVILIVKFLSLKACFSTTNLLKLEEHFLLQIYLEKSIFYF